MKIEKAFGVLLRELRTKAAFSQEQLAHDAGLDRTYISMLERGLRQPSLKTIFAISKVLRTAPSKLVAELEEKLREN